MEVLAAEAPELSVPPEQVRAQLDRGFPWHTPDVPHDHLRDADQWWGDLHPVFASSFVRMGVPSPRADALARRVRPTYLRADRFSLFDDALPALERLSAGGWVHAILSNHVPEFEAILRCLSIRDRFTHVFNSAVTGYEKPHPRAYSLAIETIGGDGLRWMIGDNFRADVLGAEAAGLQAILVRKANPQATHFFPDLTELASWLSLG